jgi:hypothetical protein
MGAQSAANGRFKQGWGVSGTDLVGRDWWPEPPQWPESPKVSVRVVRDPVI